MYSYTTYRSGIKWSSESLQDLFGISNDSAKDRFFNIKRGNFRLSREISEGVYECIIDYKIDSSGSLWIALFSENITITDSLYGGLFHDVMDAGDVIKVTGYYDHDTFTGCIFEIRVKNRKVMDVIKHIKETFIHEKINVDLYVMKTVKKDDLIISEREKEREYPYALLEYTKD